MDAQSVTIIIPAFNEGDGLVGTLAGLMPLATRSGWDELTP